MILVSYIVSGKSISWWRRKLLAIAIGAITGDSLGLGLLEYHDSIRLHSGNLVNMLQEKAAFRRTKWGKPTTHVHAFHQRNC